MACLEMERPPKHAVLFDFSAEAVDLAHENDMKVGGPREREGGDDVERRGVFETHTQQFVAIQLSLLFSRDTDSRAWT